jgi:hypothetical protein
MSNAVAQGTGGAGEQPPKPRLPSGLPANREATVAQQVGTVIAAINTFTMALTAMRGTDEMPHALSDRSKVILEGGMHAAVSRMAAILNDDARWSNANYDDLVVKLRALYEKQNNLFDTQLELANLQGSPHVVLMPRAIRLPSGGWATYVGNAGLPNGMLYGHGLTLKQALEDFDRAYYALPTAEQQFAYEQNKNWSVDNGGNDGVQQTPDAKCQVSDDSKSATPKPARRGHKDLPRQKSRKGSRRN